MKSFSALFLSTFLASCFLQLSSSNPVLGSAAMVKVPSNDCNKTDQKILWGKLDEIIHEQFDLASDQDVSYKFFDNNHTTTGYDPNEHIGRALQFECSPTYCYANPMVCMIAGCPGWRRRRNLRQLQGQGANVSEILLDADQVHNMDGRVTLSSCNASLVWAVIFYA